MHKGFRQHLLTDSALGPLLARRRTRLQLFTWFLFGILAIGLIVGQAIWEHKRHFVHANVQLASHVNDRALIAETALEGFAAFTMSFKTFSHNAAAEYASSLIDRYPFLYMFEVAVRTPHSERELLEQRLAEIYPDFRIRHFDYDNQRRWADAPAAEHYYPIIFQWPEFTDERKIVGLDLYSSEVLIDAMQRSIRLGMPVASKPFFLAENVNGYVIHRAFHEDLPMTTGALTAERYALLALRSEAMFGETPKLHPEFSVSLSYPQDTLSSPAASGTLISSAPKSTSAFERLLLPEFAQTHSLASAVPSQPFLLKTHSQMTWADLDLPLIAGVLAITFFGPWLSKRFAVAYFETKLAGMDREGLLYQMANFDSLTGVANRHRLMEQIELALLRANRDHSRFCLLFIDINKFKSINDEFGHAAGDTVLVAFSHRLDDLLRADEMLGRLGGDEFIVLINENTAHDVEALNKRIKHETTKHISYKGQNIPITISIGSACYPDDGRNISSLMEVADKRMYQEKLNSRGAAATA